MSLWRLWAFLAVALPVLGALLASLQSVDLTYHLRAGSEILQHGAIPAVDTWTFTAAGQRWTDQQWGAQVILAAVYHLGGWTGLVVLRALLVAAIFGSLLAIGRGRGLDSRRAAWLTIAAFVVSAPALSLRPQLLGMALFTLVLLLVVDRRVHPQRLWAIPVIVLVWANLHGTFFLGPLVVGLAWLEDLHDRVSSPHRAIVVAIASVAGACVTPFGPAVWSYAVGLSTNREVTERIVEWQRTSPADVPGLLFYSSAVAVALLLYRRRSTIAWPTVVWLGVFFVIGAYAVRGIAWWSLGALIPVASMLGQGGAEGDIATGRTTRPVMHRLNAVVAGAIVLVGIALVPVWRPIDPGTLAPTGMLANAPSGVTAALRDIARPGDRLLNPQIWGSWFEFALPGLPVAIDSRIELFPTTTWEAYDLVRSGGPGWEDQLSSWGVTIAVTSPADRGLLERLKDIGWRSLHDDAEGSILVAPSR